MPPAALDRSPPTRRTLPASEREQFVPALDPGRVLADPDACAALETLASRLRSIDYGGTARPVTGPDPTKTEPPSRTLARFGRGESIEEGDALDALGSDVVVALHRCGAAHIGHGKVRLGGRVFAMRSVYSLLPANPVGQDLVYLGPDSVVLFQRIWSARGFGDRAADLATGNGFIAAALATRFDHVIAADVSGRCSATAALVPVLNPHLRGRFAAVQLDVADGLRPGWFDLVTANAPWVPETVAPDGGPPRLFAAGGPTGCELPLRFLDEAVELLGGNGRAFIACLDVTFDDGRRPVADHLRELAAPGLDITMTASPLNDSFDYSTWVTEKAPGAIAAQHVVVELRRTS